MTSECGGSSIEFTILTALVVGMALSVMSFIGPLKSYFPIFPDAFSAKFIPFEPTQEETE